MGVVRSKLPPDLLEKVDDPLIAQEMRVGLARSPQMPDGLFVGITFIGLEDEEGDVVLTVELAEALAGLLNEAVAKANKERS